MLSMKFKNFINIDCKGNVLTVYEKLTNRLNIPPSNSIVSQFTRTKKHSLECKAPLVTFLNEQKTIDFIISNINKYDKDYDIEMDKDNIGIWFDILIWGIYLFNDENRILIANTYFEKILEIANNNYTKSLSKSIDTIITYVLEYKGISCVRPTFNINIFRYAINSKFYIRNDYYENPRRVIKGYMPNTKNNAFINCVIPIIKLNSFLELFRYTDTIYNLYYYVLCSNYNQPYLQNYDKCNTKDFEFSKDIKYDTDLFFDILSKTYGKKNFKTLDLTKEKFKKLSKISQWFLINLLTVASEYKNATVATNIILFIINHYDEIPSLEKEKMKNYITRILSIHIASPNVGVVFVNKDYSTKKCQKENLSKKNINKNKNFILEVVLDSMAYKNTTGIKSSLKSICRYYKTFKDCNERIPQYGYYNEHFGIKDDKEFLKIFEDHINNKSKLNKDLLSHLKMGYFEYNLKK